MSVNGMLRSMFQNVADSKWNKDRLRRNQFEELNEPFLFSSSHLNNLFDECKNKEEYESILDHMYKFDACEVDSYKEIENKIIEKLW
ncbi:hypothetical protein B5V89_16380 [Heyndrickxia sporothermodurans]|uniref:hypothetical protein n=1 Tax=Heyndrickxia TaxID=2837504 RepID=UPI000D36E4EA|nr:hypothetical protein [Heyndrickxia sporothermodurans]PTY76976.1 hypothetical protein B5V89_16380 [Heyndrickxia sporothermodurans]